MELKITISNGKGIQLTKKVNQDTEQDMINAVAKFYDVDPTLYHMTVEDRRQDRPPSDDEQQE